MTSYNAKNLPHLKLFIVRRNLFFCHDYAIYFIMCSEKRYISFVALPLMKYAFLASLDEINGIYSFQKVEHLLFMSKFVVYNFCEE